MNIKVLALISILEVFLIVLGLEVHDMIKEWKLRRKIRKLLQAEIDDCFDRAHKKYLENQGLSEKVNEEKQ